MDAITELWDQYRLYGFLAIGLIVALVILRWLLNRPTKEETEQQQRIDKLKEQHKDRYKDLRPLK
jgi:uncharacterized membrane-anchored protein YhcB (DUF1043 family)